MGKTDALYVLRTVYVHDYLKIVTTEIENFENSQDLFIKCRDLKR
jgi:hypothetical protein